MSTAPLPVCPVGELDPPSDEERWLVEPLWTRAAVGFIGGVPKLGKTWLGLDLALSVATSTPCLGRYVVKDPGRALVYLAEDHTSLVRQRLEGLCRLRGLDITKVEVDVITAPSLRLDLPRDQERLLETVRQRRPRVVLLDPLVRLHRVDENSAGDVSGLLAFLRDLQRACDVAVVLVHHMRKTGGASGQSLRGSGDFHAWIDSGCYLRRTREGVVLRVEHRSAPSPDPILLELTSDDDGENTRLEVVNASDDAPPPAAPIVLRLADRILDALGAAGGPMTKAALRKALQINNQRLGDELASLEAQSRVVHGAAGWDLERSSGGVPRKPTERRNGTPERSSY